MPRGILVDRADQCRPPFLLPVHPSFHIRLNRAPKPRAADQSIREFRPFLRNGRSRVMQMREGEGRIHRRGEARRRSSMDGFCRVSMRRNTRRSRPVKGGVVVMRSWSRSTSFRTGKGVTRTRADYDSLPALSPGSVPGLENTKTFLRALDNGRETRPTTLRSDSY